MAAVVASDTSSGSDSDVSVDESDRRARGEGLHLDYSFRDLISLPSDKGVDPAHVTAINVRGNQLTLLPPDVTCFTHLLYLDLSSNHMHDLPDSLAKLPQLKTLLAKDNNLDNDGLPKSLETMTSLHVLNLSGNDLAEFPPQILHLTALRALYLGANQIHHLPSSITRLSRLKTLYLGGNRLTQVPPALGQLHHLRSLHLCANRLVCLPQEVCGLSKLRSLTLHSNQLAILPTQITNLNLVQLTIRNNPLVARFVSDMVYAPPSLRELSGRVVKIKDIKYERGDIPDELIRYLATAKQCVNPKCKGVYFSSKVENVNFVDFCGKYKLPLLEYLCSPVCSTSDGAAYALTTSDDDDDDGGDDQSSRRKIKTVLLG